MGAFCFSKHLKLSDIYGAVCKTFEDKFRLDNRCLGQIWKRSLEIVRTPGWQHSRAAVEPRPQPPLQQRCVWFNSLKYSTVILHCVWWCSVEIQCSYTLYKAHSIYIAKKCNSIEYKTVNTVWNESAVVYTQHFNGIVSSSMVWDITNNRQYNIWGFWIETEWWACLPSNTNQPLK